MYKIITYGAAKIGILSLFIKPNIPYRTKTGTFLLSNGNLNVQLKDFS